MVSDIQMLLIYFLLYQIHLFFLGHERQSDFILFLMLLPFFQLNTFGFVNCFIGGHTAVCICCFATLLLTVNRSNAALHTSDFINTEN